MASTDATAIPIKNQAYRVTFPIYDADGDLVTGATGLDSEVSKDAGTFADCTNEATEIATSSGVYYLDLTSTEMNADTVAIIVKTTSSGAKTTPIILYPAEAADIIVNVKKVNGTDQTAGDIPALITTVDTVVDAILVDTGTTLDAALAVVDANVDAILVDTGTTLDTKLNTIDDLLDTEIAAITAAVITNAAGADVAADIIAVKAVVDAILVDTGTTLDGKIDAIDTVVDAILVDTGTTLDAAIADLPTNAELATALGTADDAVLAAIAALNNLSSADAQTAANAALVALHLDHLIADTGVVTDFGSNTTIYFDATLANNTAAGQHSGNILIFTSGANARVAKRINVLNATGGPEVGVNFQDVTSERLPVAPSAGDTFIIFVLRDEKMRGTDNAATAAALAVVDGIVDDILVDTGTTLPASIDDLPTNAELATALGTADDAVLTAIADLPTNAELATALGTADDAVLAAIAAAVVKIDAIDDLLDTEVAAIKSDTAAILLAVGTDGVVLTAAERIAIADAMLKRDWTGLTGEAQRCMLNALRSGRNKVEFTPLTATTATMTVYKEDDVTIAWTAVVTLDAAALPIIAQDPA